MYKNHCDIIEHGDNVIVGLGDSFTQGMGAYSLETWASMQPDPARYNITGQLFLEEQAKNNWVRQLCTHYLPNYKVYNLGMNGGGNRATSCELYLNPLPKNLGNVIVILMATAIERFDLLKKEDKTAGIDWHQKWQTIFPIISDRGAIAKFETEYFKEVWSERNDILEFLIIVNQVHNFCKANNYKFLFTNAFDYRINRNKMSNLLGDKKEYIDIVDWDNYISIPERESFMDMLNQLENPPAKLWEIHKIYSKKQMPTKYITPCTHWTIEGNRVVAEYLFNELKMRNLL